MAVRYVFVVLISIVVLVGVWVSWRLFTDFRGQHEARSMLLQERAAIVYEI